MGLQHNGLDPIFIPWLPQAQVSARTHTLACHGRCGDAVQVPARSERRVRHQNTTSPEWRGDQSWRPVLHKKEKADARHPPSPPVHNLSPCSLQQPYPSHCVAVTIFCVSGYTRASIPTLSSWCSRLLSEGPRPALVEECTLKHSGQKRRSTAQMHTPCLFLLS
jgi:hypothetical protein